MFKVLKDFNTPTRRLKAGDTVSSKDLAEAGIETCLAIGRIEPIASPEAAAITPEPEVAPPPPKPSRKTA